MADADATELQGNGEALGGKHRKKKTRGRGDRRRERLEAKTRLDEANPPKTRLDEAAGAKKREAPRREGHAVSRAFQFAAGSPAALSPGFGFDENRSPSDWNTRKKAGTKITVRIVAATIPPNTAVPTA